MRQARIADPQIRKEAAAEVAYFEQRDPTKHYVRRFGWLEVVESYVSRLREAGVSRPWKYFTLPGQRSIDIGLLWRATLIDKTLDGRLSVAICDDKYAEQVVLDLRPKGGVLAYSNRLLDEELDEPKSTLKAQFPFDVINLDFCTPLIPAKQSANLRVIEWIFSLQMGQAFLLLLTTRTDPTAKNRLLEVLTLNLEDDQFKKAYVQRYKGSDPKLCLADYTAFTQIVFPKALARWARDRGYKTYERFVARYKRSARVEMVCHSLEFEPIGRSAANKYAPRFKAPPLTPIDVMLNQELSKAVRTEADNAYVEFISGLPARLVTDVIAVLQGNAPLEVRLADESESLIGWYRQ